MQVGFTQGEPQMRREKKSLRFRIWHFLVVVAASAMAFAFFRGGWVVAILLPPVWIGTAIGLCQWCERQDRPGPLV
jgi:hypothetical protein